MTEILSIIVIKIIKWLKIILLIQEKKYCTPYSVVELSWLEFQDILHAKAKSWIHFEYMENIWGYTDSGWINVVSGDLCYGALVVSMTDVVESKH